jgi:CheY-like chemotaxis protein
MPVPVSDEDAAILIVDDDARKRVALRSALQPLGHRIVEVDSGIAALRQVLVEDFAVILLDVQMPVMDGFETASLIRQRKQSEMTPIIFITAYSSDEIGQHDHYAGGAVDFIFAPIPPAELRAKVSFFAHVFIDAQRLASKAQAVQSSVNELRFLTEARRSAYSRPTARTATCTRTRTGPRSPVWQRRKPSAAIGTASSRMGSEQCSQLHSPRGRAWPTASGSTSGTRNREP